MNDDETGLHLLLHGYDPARVENAVVTRPDVQIQSTDGPPTLLDQYRVAFDYTDDDGFAEHHDIVLGYLPIRENASK